MQQQKYLSEDFLSVIENYETTEDFASMLDEHSGGEKREGNLVTGKIITVDRKRGETLIDIGFKTEGYIKLSEFIEEPSAAELIAGMEVEVFVERPENHQGFADLSREKAVRQRMWDHLKENFNEGDIIEGSIFGRVKGGFTVDINGVIAFLPGSQVDIRPLRDITPLMNMKQPFQILKLDNAQGNIVVSRRAVLEETRREERDDMLSKVQEGMIFDGIVKNITDYGAFIDLGSVDGLLHVTDISWSRISHPTEILSLGQKIQVKVIKFNQENKRISLGMKQLQENPWSGIQDKFPKGMRTFGTVTNIADYGIFVELEQGVEGLVHVSEISWTKQNIHPSKIVSIGEQIEVMVLNVDTTKHRISLGIKQCTDNPWKAFADQHKAGDKIKGKVKNIVDFGMFVGLNEQIDGLVHVSDLTWAENGDAELKKFSEGDELELQILSVEPEKERISLGLKQLEANPQRDAMENLEKGAVTTAVVDEISADGIYVLINNSIRTFIKRNDLSSERVDQRADRFAVGDRVDVKLITVDKKSFNITASIKALEVEEQKRAIAEYGSADSGASLGDILGAALKMSKQENEEG